MIVANTINQFNSLSLPGYGNSAELTDVITHPQTGSVLTALIASRNPQSDEIEFLTGVRGGGADQLYQWAISIGTGAITDQELQAIIDESTGLERRPLNEQVNITMAEPGYQGDLSVFRQVVKTYEANPQTLAVGGLSLVSSTNALLKRKFSVHNRPADFHGTVSHYDTVVGLVGADEEGIEYNTFANTVVMLDDRDVIPENTASYSNLGWTNRERFLEGLATKRPTLLNPNLDGEALAYICTRGQCMLGAVSILEQKEELNVHLGIGS